MKITFVLPLYADYPIGGFRIVYEYANRLAERGHELTVVHPRFMTPAVSLKDRIKPYGWEKRMLRKNGRLVPWFPVRDDVRLLLTPDLREKFVPDADVVIATAWETAGPLSSYSAAKGKKYYFIQHYELWSGKPAQIDETWRLPLHKIVIARWLRNKAKELGSDGPVTYIPNGMDFTHYRLETPIAERPMRVGMLNHHMDWKGTPDGLAALEIARKEFPEMQVSLFGIPPRDATIPDWMEYHHEPTGDALCKLYNSYSIFVHPSWAEGWPLPPAEAMSCGCALVAADNDGVTDYAHADETALVAPKKNPPALAEQLLRLLRDDSLRQKIAQAGHDDIRQYTWTRASDSLENLLTGKGDGE